jgi:hypothetical protein
LCSVYRRWVLSKAEILHFRTVLGGFRRPKTLIKSRSVLVWIWLDWFNVTKISDVINQTNNTHL